MTLPRLLGLCLVLAWLASGFFIIRGNEQGLVRRFGRASPVPARSGLHWNLPWPLSRVDRVNVSELRTLTIGVAAPDSQDPQGFLRPTGLDRVGEFLTGDKNLLNLQVHVQYRIADPYLWLCTVETPEVVLRLLTENCLAEAVSQSGVDYVHPLGLNELRQRLTRDLLRISPEDRLGAAIEDVTIAAVWPPVEVKGAFLDVSNARAEKDTQIEQERSRAEQRLTSARSQARQRLDLAETARRGFIESARGQADRFRALVAAVAPTAQTPAEQSLARERALRRLWLDSLSQIWPNLGRTLVIETDQPVDLRLFPPATPTPAAEPSNWPGASNRQ
ncbi:MAG: protease modulator HflK [Planctomycetaceae bacterium]